MVLKDAHSNAKEAVDLATFLSPSLARYLSLSFACLRDMSAIIAIATGREDRDMGTSMDRRNKQSRPHGHGTVRGRERFGWEAIPCRNTHN
jgi:hypothetical protein